VVVDAIRALALKFPDKHRALMTFLAGALRDEGGFAFKKAIVDAILDIITQVVHCVVDRMHVCVDALCDRCRCPRPRRSVSCICASSSRTASLRTSRSRY
jgi:hypothetical protein